MKHFVTTSISYMVEWNSSIRSHFVISNSPSCDSLSAKLFLECRIVEHSMSRVKSLSAVFDCVLYLCRLSKRGFLSLSFKRFFSTFLRILSKLLPQLLAFLPSRSVFTLEINYSTWQSNRDDKSNQISCKHTHCDSENVWIKMNRCSGRQSRANSQIHKKKSFKTIKKRKNQTKS